MPRSQEKADILRELYVYYTQRRELSQLEVENLNPKRRNNKGTGLKNSVSYYKADTQRPGVTHYLHICNNFIYAHIL